MSKFILDLYANLIPTVAEIPTVADIWIFLIILHIMLKI